MKQKINLFEEGKTYTLKVKRDKGKLTVYTATIILETENHIKFYDRDGEEIILRKDEISEAKE